METTSQCYKYNTVHNTLNGALNISPYVKEVAWWTLIQTAFKSTAAWAQPLT